ncbi:alpha/beta hydrolase family protein [Cellulomonas pakistanensis]|uniref:alpha/beta hydrolase family protein n=1 Tax=Cellulomonas pakistanensis TaxID=992287 RepID=UPI0019435710|nr:alpha/beta family hydrolase [Cellulomonas pakistanensis]
MSSLDIATPQGPARAHLHLPAGVAPGADGRTRVPGALVLGHGAGGGVGAPDLLAVTAAATGLGLAVALVEQPYRVAGKRVGPRGPALDEAWTAVVAHLRTHALDAPLVTGGRSAGARTACRTALATGAVGVLCLAFPTQPPGRPDAPSRLPELEAAGVPVLVVQGRTDPYGTPAAAPTRTVVPVPGDHSLKKDTGSVAAAVTTWLPTVLPLP